MLNNPPIKMLNGSYVKCISVNRGWLTIGKKYRIRGYFKYLNTYGSSGSKYLRWDEFITIKNDGGWTVKVNLNRFNSCDPPYTNISYLAKRVKLLETERI